MTTEQKAKAYDKAVKEASIAYKDEDKHLKATLERIFPELKESEDEKIRKVLVGFFKSYKEQGTCGAETFNGIPTENILAWLEKQSERKPTWTEEDEKRLNSCLIILQPKTLVGNTETMNTKWLKSLKERMGG